MDEVQSRISVSDRILNDLRSIVKQIYYESVNDELNQENKTYLCTTLIKNLDEALSFGLKQLHLGYWKAIQNVLHPESLSELEQLPKYNGLDCTNFNKGRTWIAIALKEDYFVNYINCMVQETSMNKFYEKWSIIRNNDKCNKFLSILSGIDNINFIFHIEFMNKPPSFCDFCSKVVKEQELKLRFKNLNTSKNSINLTASSSSLTSPVDSGVHIQDSSSDMEQLPEDKSADMDYLNGNVPETIMRKKSKKNTKRHVSFHEDIIYKSPDKYRKLKWDHENLRYSWSGEEIDSSILIDTDFSKIKLELASANNTDKVLDINERGAPEGEETPCNLENVKRITKTQKSIIVKRFLQSINKQSKIRQFTKKYSTVSPYQFLKAKIDKDLVSEINNEIKAECELQGERNTSQYEVSLKLNVIKQMIKQEYIYKAYQLRDYLFIITNANIYIVNKILEINKISLNNVREIVIYPDSHVFWIWETKEKFHMFVTEIEELTNKIMGRLEICIRKNHFELPKFHILQHDDLLHLKSQLISKCAIDRSENFFYFGFIKLEKQTEQLDCSRENSKRGFLMYRDQRVNDNWIPGDFLLKSSILYLYVDGCKNPKFAINLSNTCRSCSRTMNSGRPYTFQITIADESDFHSEVNFSQDKLIKSKFLKSDTHKLFSEIRQKVNKLLTFGNNYEDGYVIEFAAANEYELSDWLQMIIRASCGDCGEDASRDDVIEGTLIISENSLLITNEMFTGNKMEIISRATISDVSGFRIGEDKEDLFVLIEFSCMEATITSGDWVFFMSSRNELEKLSAVLRFLWCFKNKFPESYLTDERLINKYRNTQASLCKKYWTHLLE